MSTYPPRCVVELERRTIPGEDRDTVVREMDGLLRALAARDPAFKAECDVFFYRSSFEVSPDEPIVRALRQASIDVMGREPEIGGSTAWLDSAVLKDAGIPTAVFGAGGTGAHSAVEWADFDSVVDCARVLSRAIATFCA